MRGRSRFNSIGFNVGVSALAIVAIFGGAFLAQFLDKNNDSGALSATEFKAGRIIDDSIFYNPNTMTAAEIDAFIDSHTSACDTWGKQKIGNTRFYGVQASNNTTRAEYMKYMRNAGYTQYHDAPFICIRDYYENPKTHKTNFETGGKVEKGMISAGQIIYNAAHEYNVNPQVLLVMLKKESYAWGDDWPLKFEYNTVMGYGCPDNAACDQDYFGFYNQVMTAAWQINYYREHPNDYRYRPGRSVNVYYSPDYSCGTKKVYIENYATAGLYIYTPYPPNDAALANYPGTSYCGSYGNRNFYMYFREWFGSTEGIAKEEISFPDGEYYIVSAANPQMALRLEDGSSDNTKDIFEDQRTESPYGHFILSQQNDGSYVITNSGSKKALNIYSSSVYGAEIGTWNQHNGANQRFRILNNRDGSFSFVSNNNTGLAVTLSSEGGMKLDVYTRSKQQSFRLIHTEAPVEDGSYYAFSALDAGKALDVQGGNITKNGANIELYFAHRTQNQTFNFTYNEDTGYYRITPEYTDSYSLDVNGAKTTNLANVQLWSNNTSCAQNWHIDTVENNKIRLLSACSGLALDIEGGQPSSGSNISIYPYHGGKNQIWALETVTKTQKDLDDNTPAVEDKPASSPEKKDESKNEIISGVHTIRNAKRNSFSIDITGISPANNTNIELWPNNASAAQKFNFTYDKTSKAYRISDTYTNRSLDASGGVSRNGANVVMWIENGGCNQRWRLIKNEDGSYRILDSCGGRALDLFNSNYRAGADIGIWDYHGGDNQRWTIE